MTLYEVLGVKPTATADEIRHAYRELAKDCHPDRHQGSKSLVDLQARIRELNEAHAVLSNPAKRHRYDTIGTLALAPVTIRTAKHAYTLVAPRMAEGDLANLYRGTDETGQRVLVKVAKSHTVNDLLVNEARLLKLMDAAFVKEPPPSLVRDLFPTLIESAIVTDAVTKSRRQVNVFAWRDDMVSLAEVLNVYKDGLESRHVVWIGNRLWAALDIAHSKVGVLHGAICPSHVLVHPPSHAVMIVDWCYGAVPTDPRFPARRKGGWAVPEAITSRPQPQADVYGIAQTLLSISDGRLERPFARFLASCSVMNPARRPDDCGVLYDQWQDLASEVFGPRKFVELTMRG